jgi:hypothetical protein
LDIDERLQEAIQSYWDARKKNKKKQVDSGKIDAERWRFLSLTFFAMPGWKNSMFALGRRWNCLDISGLRRNGT